MLWEKNKVDRDRGRRLARPPRATSRSATTSTRPAPSSSPPARWRCRSPASSSATASLDTWGAWSLPEQPKKIAVVGAGASGSRDRLRLRPLRHRGAADRDARPDPPRRGQGHGPGRRARLQEAGHRRSPPAAPVENVEAGEDSVKFTYGDKSAEVDYLCIAGGRAPDIEGLGLEEAGVELEENGKIKVDEYQRTSNPKVYAIGDLVNAKALAHKASEEGVVAVEHAAGAETHPVDQNLVAGATFCHPQVASVGLTEAAGQGGRARGQGRQAETRRRRRRDRLRRQRRPGQARRRRQVRRDPRRPHRRQPRLRHDRRAGRDDGARGRLPGAGADRPPPPDDLRGDPRRGPRRRRLGRPTPERRRPRHLLLRPRLALRVPDRGADQRALHRGRAGAAGVAADPARRPVPALRPRLLGADGRARAEGIAEVERRAAAYGLPPLVWPEPWPGNTLFAMRAATFAKQTGRTVSFALAAFRQAFAAGRDLTDPDNVLIAGRRLRAAPAGAAESGRDRSRSRTRCGRRPTAPATSASNGVPALVVGERGLLGRRPARGGGRSRPS